MDNPPPDFPDHYQVLQVGFGADEAAIRASFKMLARIRHPDKDQKNPNATAAFQQLEAAYSVLIDPAQRRDYDSQRRANPTKTRHNPEPQPSAPGTQRSQENPPPPVHFQCQLCHRYFTTGDDLAAHRAIWKDRGYRCHVCDIDFKCSDVSQKKHVTTFHYRCAVCPAYFGCDAERLLHAVNHQFQCHDCDSWFTTLSEGTRHPARCQDCTKLFRLKLELYRYLQNLDGYTCQWCSKRFSTSRERDTHVYEHHGNTWW